MCGKNVVIAKHLDRSLSATKWARQQFRFTHSLFLPENDLRGDNSRLSVSNPTPDEATRYIPTIVQDRADTGETLSQRRIPIASAPHTTMLPYRVHPPCLTLPTAAN